MRLERPDVAISMGAETSENSSGRTTMSACARLDLFSEDEVSVVGVSSSGLNLPSYLGEPGFDGCALLSQPLCNFAYVISPLWECSIHHHEDNLVVYMFYDSDVVWTLPSVSSLVYSFVVTNIMCCSTYFHLVGQPLAYAAVPFFGPIS